jgi:HAD superfamily hydrolase (TIGR01509 family)
MAIQAILWDNDGVLVDTEKLYFQATREAMAEVGVELTERLYVQFLLIEGRGPWHLAEGRGIPAERISQLKGRRDARFRELLRGEDVLIEGALDALRLVRKRYRMALVTSSEREHLELVHRSTGVLPEFELILARESYRNAKPDPEPYLCAMEQLRLSKNECLVVEDSERGLRAAKAAGLACWVIPNRLSRQGCFDCADRVFESISEVARELTVDGRFEGREGERPLGRS